MTTRDDEYNEKTTTFREQVMNSLGRLETKIENAIDDISGHRPRIDSVESRLVKIETQTNIVAAVGAVILAAVGGVIAFVAQHMWPTH